MDVDTPPVAAPVRRSVALWSLLVLLVCGHFAISVVVNHRQFLDLARFTHGEATTPYQYRALMAWTLRALGEAAPFQALARAMPGALKNPYALASCAVDFVAVLGAVLATRATLERLTGAKTFAAWASLLVVYMAYFHFGLAYGLNYALPYDVPGLLFFALAFLAIVARNDPLYYGAFVLAAFGRETIILAAVPFAVWRLYDASGARADRGWRGVWPHVVAQLLIILLVKALIVRLYAGRTPLPDDAGLFETHLRGNLFSFLNPYQWPLLASVFGFALPLVVLYRDRIADARLRRSLRIMLPLWGIAMFVVGNVVEIRTFGELIVPVALGAALIAHRTLALTTLRSEAAA